MLASAGKLSSIGEMLTINEAASPPPGDRHMNDFDSFSCSVHCGGTVHDIPCLSHFACCPPAGAAVCAAVGSPCSAVLPPPPPLALVPLELEPLLCSFSERLQREREKQIVTASRICFILATACIRKARSSQPELHESTVI